MSESMETVVPVSCASRSYEVHVGVGNLAGVGAVTRKAAGGERACVVTETNVGPLYADAVKKSLEDAGYKASIITFPAGEQHKRLSTLEGILEALAEEQLTRDDVVVALGGGVTGDMAGLAAAMYLRGIQVVQVPTSLLAMVDSSVGGKVAVDLSHGKNLCGFFWQPSAVVADVACLRTIEPALFRDSVGEVVKHAVLADPGMLRLLSQRPLVSEAFSEDEVARIVAENVRIKRDVVDADEREHGLRQTLNLGHTIGHGIEAVKGIKGRRTVGLYHGECVALGMLPMIESKALQKRVRGVYRRLGLPTRTAYDKEKVLAEMLHDKKAQDGQITIIKVPGLGCWRAETIPVEGLRPLLGMED